MLQNTQEWLEFRKSRIGASEANIIMGVSKFSTPKKLLNYKLSKEVEQKKENTFITDKGHRLEEKIRAFIEVEIGSDFPATVAVHNDIPWLMASLDGYNEESNIVLECKYVGAADFEKVNNGQWLDQYYPQVQHQMLVTGASKNILAVAKENKEKELFYAYMFVDRDNKYIQEKLFPALKSFYKKMQEGSSEIALTKSDTYDQSYDKELCSMVNEYRVLSDTAKEISAKIKDLKEKIFEKVEHDNVICNGAKIKSYKIKGRESFDYKKYFEGKEIPQEFLKIGKPSVGKRIDL